MPSWEWNPVISVQPSYIYIFALMILEGMSLPIPSEIVMPLVGYYSTKGLLDPYLGIIVGTVGSLVGSLIDYYIALKLGVPSSIDTASYSNSLLKNWMHYQDGLLSTVRSLCSFQVYSSL